MGIQDEPGRLTVLLEREAQLASLGDYAADARRGEGRLVLISGEAGVGKTTLVERAQRELPAASWHWGACDGLSTPRPLGPLFDIAESAGGELRALGQASAPRDELFSALLRQVSGSPAAEPNVLVIEDAHWADEATIDLLRFLGRRIRNAPVPTSIMGYQIFFQGIPGEAPVGALGKDESGWSGTLSCRRIARRIATGGPGGAGVCSSA